ncbi:MAG: hypothetical protein Roseis2KO_52190 [Roseivirga sp.]
MLSLYACDDLEVPNKDADYVIFGRYAGFCQGDCFSVFRVNSTSLVEDETSEYFTGDNYQFVPGRTLSDTHYGLAQVLLTKIPAELLVTSKTTFGCPDCADQGGFYLSFSIGDVVKNIRLDTRQTDDQSEEVLLFKQQLSDVIQAIQ